LTARHLLTRAEETAAGSETIIAEGALEWHDDTDKLYVSDGTTKLEVYPGSGGGGTYTDEEAQDAIGSILTDTSTVDLSYVDLPPSISGQVPDNSITFDKIQNINTDKLLGREASGSGDVEEISLGSNLVLSSGTLNTTGPSIRLPCWDNPPSSPHAYDDEFNSTTLDGKWTASATNTTNALTTGTVDYLSNLTTPIYDLTSHPGWLMMQSDNTARAGNPLINFTQTITLDTNATIFTKSGGIVFDPTTNGEGTLYFELSNSSDADELFQWGCGHNTNGYTNFFQITNAGVVTSQVFNQSLAPNMYGQPAMYHAMWKSGDVYFFGFGQVSGVITRVYGGLTKTGVTTFDRLSIRFACGAYVPSVVEGVDFIRYYPSNVGGFANP
jgi:hypothetical protein